MFAKIFGKGDGQVLLMKRQSDDGKPMMVVFINHPRHGIFESANTFGSVHERDKAFNEIDEAAAFLKRDELFRDVPPELFA